MNTAVLARSAGAGSQPSTVGMKPENARIPAGAGRSGPRVAHHRAHREPAENRALGGQARALPQLVVEGGQLGVRGVERARIRIADSRHEVPMGAGRSRQRQRCARRRYVERPSRVERVGEREQVMLVGTAAVVQDEQSGARGRPLTERQGRMMTHLRSVEVRDDFSSRGALGRWLLAATPS